MRAKIQSLITQNPAFNIVDWGYTEQADSLSFRRYEKWIEGGKAEPLNYLTGDRFEKRKSLKHYYPEFQSALVFLFSYAPAKKWLEKQKRSKRLASYVFAAGGTDYHLSLKTRLEAISKILFGTSIKSKFGLDTQPILERDLAYRAGLGWFGKNSMLISRTAGSYVMLGSLLLDHKLTGIQNRVLETDHCGTCSACVDACPTNAIDAVSRTLTSNKCLSTFTIELFSPAPAPDGREKSRGEIFGCDICQEVCPWNQADVTGEFELDEQGDKLKQFFLDRDIHDIKMDIDQMSSRGYARAFKHTALGRTGKKGMLKNL